MLPRSGPGVDIVVDSQPLGGVKGRRDRGGHAGAVTCQDPQRPRFGQGRLRLTGWGRQRGLWRCRMMLPSPEGCRGRRRRGRAIGSRDLCSMHFITPGKDTINHRSRLDATRCVSIRPVVRGWWGYSCGFCWPSGRVLARQWNDPTVAIVR